MIVGYCHCPLLCRKSDWNSVIVEIHFRESLDNNSLWIFDLSYLISQIPISWHTITRDAMIAGAQKTTKLFDSKGWKEHLSQTLYNSCKNNNLWFAVFFRWVMLWWIIFNANCWETLCRFLCIYNFPFFASSIVNIRYVESELDSSLSKWKSGRGRWFLSATYLIHIARKN
jgi:hypothetical protein